MTIEFDQKENGVLRLGSGGFSISRSGIISGVADAGDPAYLVNAYNDGDMPAYGSAHPEIAGIYLLDIAVSPMDCGKARVVLSYRAPDPVDLPVDNTGQGLIEITAASVSVQTEKDVNGDQISVSHDFTSTQPERNIETQGGTVKTMVAQIVLRQTRKETANSLSLSLGYVNKLNPESSGRRLGTFTRCGTLRRYYFRR